MEWFAQRHCKCLITEMTDDQWSEYVVLRCAPPANCPGPPRVRGVVWAGTALADIGRVRSFMRLCGVEIPIGLRSGGPEALGRLLRPGRSDTVAKTPVPLRAVQEWAREVGTGKMHRALTALQLVTGFFFFMRGGEVEMEQGCIELEIVAKQVRRVHVLFTHGKAEGGKCAKGLARAKIRSCIASSLLLAWTSIIGRGWKVGKDAFGLTTEEVRRALIDRLGPPPPDIFGRPGGPWSLRAGAATEAFKRGASMDVVRRMGRWASETAALYVGFSTEQNLLLALVWAEEGEPDDEEKEWLQEHEGHPSGRQGP